MRRIPSRLLLSRSQFPLNEARRRTSCQAQESQWKFLLLNLEYTRFPSVPIDYRPHTLIAMMSKRRGVLTAGTSAFHEKKHLTQVTTVLQLLLGAAAYSYRMSQSMSI